MRAGLRWLEDYEMSAQERVRRIKAKIDAAWDDPYPSLPLDEVFERLEALHT